MENNNIYRTAKPWQIRIAPLADGANNLFLMLLMQVSYLASGGYGIATAAIGIILTCTRLWDGVTDPIVAFIAERIPRARLRILLWGGWGIMSISLLCMFYLGIEHGPVVFVITYLIYIMGYTMFGIGKQTANAVLSNDPKQRPLISRWSTYYAIGFMLLLNMLMTGVLLPKYGGEFSIEMMQASLIVVLVLSAILLILSTIAIAPVDKPETFAVGKREKPISIGDMWKMIKENRALQMFIVAASSDKLALNIAGNTAFATMLYGMLIGNMLMSSMLSLVSMPINIIASICATKMAIKKGNKHALVYWTTFAIIASCITAVVYLVIDFPGVFKAAVPTILFLVVYFLRNFGQNATSAMTNAVLADVADYEAYRTGNYMPGTVSACYSFVDKMISSLSTTIAGVALALVGYANTMPQPTDVPTASTVPIVIFMTICMPVLGWLCTLVAMKFYPLTAEKMVEVQTCNHEAREAAKRAKNA